MARRHGILLGTLAAAALVVGSALPAQAAPPPVAPPPSPQEIATATNAMLSFDLPRVLESGAAPGGGLSTGFLSPPGGQDPLPVCVYGPQYTTVSVPDTLAVGYSARNGLVTQSVYEYPTAAAAARAWARLDADIAAHCSGRFTIEGSTVTVTRERLAPTAAAGRGWSVTTTGLGSVTQVAAAPVGDAIQVTSYVREAETLAARVPAAIARLSGVLAGRWAARATLPDRQGPLLTGAALAGMTPADVPTTLPVTAPQDGGWSTYQAQAPGDGPWTCAQTSDLDGGSWSFSTSLGGTGDIVSEPGSLLQDVEVYQTPDAARVAWAQLRRAVLACNDPGRNPLTTSDTSTRTLSGLSALVVDGEPGVWSRQFSVDRSMPLSGKSYSISLLSGATIQTLTYYVTIDEATQVPLDQLAVNTLAEQLLQRWTATQSAEDAAAG